MSNTDRTWEDVRAALLSASEPPPDLAGHLRWLNLRTGQTAFAEAGRQWEKFPSWAREAGPDARRAVMAPDLLSAAESWDGHPLLLVGPTGTGKTTAATHAAEALIRRRIASKRLPPTIHFAKATALNSARRQHGLGQGEAPEIIAAIVAGILIVDDLGQEKTDIEVWFAILDARYDAKRPTVVTSGFPLAELGQRYGEHLIRRIVETGKTNGKTAGKIVSVFADKK